MPAGMTFSRDTHELLLSVPDLWWLNGQRLRAGRSNAEHGRALLIRVDEWGHKHRRYVCRTRFLSNHLLLGNANAATAQE